MGNPAWWRSACIAALPAVIVLLLVAALFHAPPDRFLPMWSDEVVYWNETAVFDRAGFDGGYITIHEEPARAAFTHFGPHGFVFPVLHGAVARVLGWHPSSAFFINLIVVSLAAFAWSRGVRGGTSLSATFVVAAFWPLLLYLPTNMEEPTHFAIAFLTALAIERHARGAGAATVWTAVLLIVGSLMRPSWAIMVLPIGWRRARARGWTGIVALLAATVVATAVAWAAFDILSSPSPQNTRALTQTLRESPARAAGEAVQLVAKNLRQYVARTEEPPQVILRYFEALFVLLLVAGMLRARARRADDDAVAVETAFLAFAPILFLVVVAGQVESWRDFRVLAPHLLVSLLVLVSAGRWERWSWGATLLFAPALYAGFLAFHQARFTESPQPIAALRAATLPVMTFDADASPWRNTVLVHSDLLQFPLLGISPGIGVSYVFDWDNLPPPVRSGYLLLRPSDYEQVAPKVRLEPLAETPLGTLYRNAGPQGLE
jgi:hypothetical protein